MSEIRYDSQPVVQERELGFLEHSLTANRLLLSTALGTALAVFSPSPTTQAAEPEGPKPAPTEESKTPDEGKWKGIQIKTAISAEKQLTSTLSWTASVANLRWPKAKAFPYFVFTGPKFKLSEWAWASPQIGFSTGYLGKEWVAGSLALGLARKKISLLIAQDLYIRPKELATYTYISADFNPIPQINLGIHTEGVNDQFTAGPHLGWQAKKLNFGLQSFTGEDGGTTARVVTHISF